MKIDSDSYLGSNIFVGQAIYSIKTCLLRKTISNRRVLNNNVNIFISNILWTTHFGINRTLLIMHYELCIEKAHGCVISPRRGSILPPVALPMVAYKRLRMVTPCGRKKRSSDQQYRQLRSLWSLKSGYEWSRTADDRSGQQISSFASSVARHSPIYRQLYPLSW